MPGRHQEMLGKHSYYLQRATSKMQLMPDDNLVIAPAIDKSKPSTPVFGVTRQVIGFNPVTKDIEVAANPPSLLPAVGSGSSQARSPRSPRSGLESLLCSPRPWGKKSNEGIGFGIVAALSTPEDDAAKNERVEASKTPTINMGELQCSFKKSEPIPISQPHSLCSFPGENDQLGKGNSYDDHSPAWILGELKSDSNKFDHPSLYGTLIDVEMDARESIFSAASPASSCGENCGLLPEIDFLNACYFCKRQLGEGKDIYMYRGDRAFCSVECRYQQIVFDERKERCSTSLPSTSAKHRGRILTATPAAAA